MYIYIYRGEGFFFFFAEEEEVTHGDKNYYIIGSAHYLLHIYIQRFRHPEIMKRAIL